MEEKIQELYSMGTFLEEYNDQLSTQIHHKENKLSYLMEIKEKVNMMTKVFNECGFLQPNNLAKGVLTTPGTTGLTTTLNHDSPYGKISHTLTNSVDYR